MTARPLSLYALVAGVLFTAVVLGWDAATPRAALPETLRGGGAAAMSPLLTRIAESFPPPPESAEALTETTARLALTEDELRRSTQQADLATTPHIAALSDQGHDIVLGRVVAVGAPGAAGPERLTIDLGTEDGIALDQSVVAADGLVGRTVRVGRTTSDVLIVGAADLVVGARALDSQLLGTVTPPASGDPAAREHGELTLTTISFGDLRTGEQVVTVGSPDDTPLVAGIPVGKITSVDPPRGRVDVTATLLPAVDIGTLDVVAVIVPGGR
ncbi:MAG: rod shape-determining protein MreC [Actinomycetales bacterium]|nr:rod shape-determining protein MreC [Actinomycetales bacterium]